MNKNLIFLLLGFSLVMAGFGPAESYFSSIFYSENIRNISLISISLIYIFLVFSDFFAPYFCRKLGLRRALFLSSFAYPLFILSVASGNLIFLYACSALLGFAASIMITSQSTYLVMQSSDKNRSFVSGLSFSIVLVATSAVLFFMSFFVGQVSYKYIYLILSLIAFSGSISFLFLSKTKKTELSRAYPFSLFKRKRTLLLIPFIFSTGLISGSTLSIIPLRITEYFGLDYVGKIISISTFSTIFLCLLIGKLADRYGLKPFISLAVGMGLVGLIMLLFFSDSLVIFVLAMFLLSFQRAGAFALVYPIIFRIFPGETDSAMAVRSMMNAGAVFSSTILSLFLGFTPVITIVFILALIAFFSIRKLDLA